MGTKGKDWPSWVERALQGVTYWIGHRRCLYRHYPLAEGALVAEICNLIHANLADNLILDCEVQYATILPDAPKQEGLGEGEKVFAQRARADLVVSEKLADGSKDPSRRFIIEIKRASAGNGQIDADLRRLAECRRRYPDGRAFMFLIAEANRPVRFVNEKGSSRKGRQKIPKSAGNYRVRRTWKAAHAYSNVERAQYACLIEVYTE